MSDQVTTRTAQEGGSTGMLSLQSRVGPIASDGLAKSTSKLCPPVRVEDSPASDHEQSIAALQPPRDSGLDFTKGALVLFMVLYHWLNYFVSPQGQYYNYLRFLTPSFIFITGFMISQVHLQRYGASGSQLSKRLIVRGLKLLIVFFGLNVLVGVALEGLQFRYSLPSRLFSAVISGNVAVSAGQKSAAFSILVPIAYLLILSAPLMTLTRRFKHIFHLALAFFVMAIILLHYSGINSVYLDLLMIGLLGVVFGFARRDQISAVVDHPYVLISLYCVFLVIITFRDVTLPLQTLSVVLTTPLLYIAGSSKLLSGAIPRCMILLGRYSLLGYIVQIAFLRVLKGIAWLSTHGVGVLIASLLLGVLATVVTVELVDSATRRSRTAKKLYELVFA
jgi:peptidoglycan/LPS O-acetylase OafA/YrhL